MKCNGTSTFQTIIRVRSAISDAVMCGFTSHSDYLQEKLTNKYTEKFGIFNYSSRDHSTSIKSTETSWSSVRYFITVKQ